MRFPRSFLLLALLPSFAGIPARAVDSTADVVIYGGNAAGAMAAIQAGRMGGTVILLEPGPAIGGLTTGGLGATDVGDPRAVGGLAKEFYQRIHAHYSQASAWRHETRAAYVPRHPLAVSDALGLHWFFEPHVAAQTFDAMLASPRITVHLRARLDRGHGVQRAGGRITALTLVDGRTFRGRVFVDATYEGDLMAAAGVSYAVGRDANERYGETLNGIRWLAPDRTNAVDPYVRAGDPSSGRLPRIAPRAPGPAGAADPAVQSYNFRVCLTAEPENRIPFTRPATYDPLNYELLLRLIQGQDVRPGPDLFTLTPLPNRKTDTNNRGLFSTDFVGANAAWPEASDAEREKIWHAHKDYTQGLFWFLAHDPRVPEAVRREVDRWGLARDEFAATEHWPFQLYVREARRLVGEYVITEHDARRRTQVADPVALASYALDSHVAGYFVDEGGRLRIEGTFFENIRAFPLSYRALLPQARECGNLLVPVCLSASHAAYGSVRMEPVFMMLGQAAGTAAMLALQSGTTLHALPYAQLATRLRADGQVLALEPARAEPNRNVKPASAEAVAALTKLAQQDFLCAAEAATSFWRNAARPGARCEAERIAALLIAAAQRFDRAATEVGPALAVLTRRGAPLDPAVWTRLTEPHTHCPGERVSEALIALAGLF